MDIITLYDYIYIRLWRHTRTRRHRQFNVQNPIGINLVPMDASIFYYAYAYTPTTFTYTYLADIFR